MAMPRKYQRFLIDLAGKIGPPIFSGTLVGCILSSKFETVHGVLMGVGIALISVNYWYNHS